MSASPLLRRLAGQRQLQAMVIPGVVWMLVFRYVPLWFLSGLCS